VQDCRTDRIDPPAAHTMNEAPEPNGRLYAIRLLPLETGGAAAQFAGRLEHVLSGRCHDFDDGATLLACLAFEQQQQQLQQQAAQGGR